MNAGRVFYNVSMALALAVGALQVFHVRGGLLTDYGAAALTAKGGKQEEARSLSQRDASAVSKRPRIPSSPRFSRGAMVN